MAKFSKVDENIQKLIDDINSEIGLDRYAVEFEGICPSREMKEAVKIVKANEYTEYKTGKEDLLFVLVNEPLFESVDEQTQYLWLRMAMDTWYYDTEKDKLLQSKDSFTIPVGMYEKFKDVAVNAALLQFHSIKQLKEKRKQEAAEKKSLRIKGGNRR